MFSFSTDVYTPQVIAEQIPRLGAQSGQPYSNMVPVSPAQQEEQDEEPVRVTISKEASDMMEKVDGESLPAAAAEESSDTQSDSQKNTADNETGSSEEQKDSNNLSSSEEQMVQKLQARDREVRAHEQSHMAVAGDLTIGGPQYNYQKGPDGKMYAIGGHVDIDTSSDSDPDKAQLKAQKIRSAALASGDASAADVAAASQAGEMEQSSISAKTENALIPLAAKIRNMYSGALPTATGNLLNIMG